MTAATDLDTAMDLADIANAITMNRFHARDLLVRHKPDRTPVTDADLKVEDSLRIVLAERRPADTIAGEERGGSIGPGRTWVIDPIDGTKNFLRGFPAWATLIALVSDGTPVVGVISAPAMGKRWYASAGAGAFGRSRFEEPERISVSKVSEISDAYMSTTNLTTWVEHHSRDAYLRLVDTCWENRAFGDFWQHCLVAEGLIDLAVEPIVSPWDVAAVQIVVEEAGGTFTDLAGRARFDGGNALSSNGLLHDAALELLKA